MPLRNLLRTLLFLNVSLLFLVAETAYGQSNEQGEFEIPGTGYRVEFGNDRGSKYDLPPLLVDALICWVVCNTDLPEPGTAPNFRFLQEGTMPNPANSDVSDAPKDPRPNMLEIKALYDRTSGTIILPEAWRPSPLDLSSLVHELVHHLQAEANLRYACPAASEALAYNAQEKWLTLFGLTLEEGFDIDRLTRYVLTNCGF